VAWYGVNIAGVKYLGWKYEELDDRGFDVFPLYAAPQPRKRLTDETLWEMWVESPSDVLRFARAIERAHGIGEQE